MTPSEELFDLAKKMSEAARLGDADDIAKSLEALDAAVEQVSRSFSGSWMGYHSRVYYADLSPAPPGAQFSKETGISRPLQHNETVGNWEEFDPEIVKLRILELAGTPDSDNFHQAEKIAIEAFDFAKSEMMSILETELASREDSFLRKLRDDLENLKATSKMDFVHLWTPRGQILISDTLALNQGNQLPPHIDIRADVTAVRNSFRICKAASEIGRKAASHLERASKKKRESERIGTNVFIGHGGSLVWRELKDFVQDRLNLPWDEFNRVPVAGITNIARLSEMLDAAAVAFLVMTAEDEMVDGEIQARMNVVHEAGLFQGRLGFTKAIVVLEEGCEEFSNIQGLGQVRFPTGNIAAAFEEIRLVLEREGLLSIDE